MTFHDDDATRLEALRRILEEDRPARWPAWTVAGLVVICTIWVVAALALMVGIRW
jgi:hypothetical protein